MQSSSLGQPKLASSIASSIPAAVVQARAVDGEGKPVTKAAEVKWTVDASAPAVEITSGPGQGEKLPDDGGAPAFTFQVMMLKGP